MFRIWYFHHSHGFGAVDQGEPQTLSGLRADLNRTELGNKEFIIYDGS